MKISLNWLSDYLDLSDYSVEKLSDIFTSLGLEVAGVEHIETVKGGLKGIVIGHVQTVHKHPNADRLSCTTVDIGTGEPLKIVCGAPNVAPGQKVPVAVEGTVLYNPNGESWEIKKGKIRGEISEGMICAEDELGLGDSHAGIMILPDNLVPGTKASDYFNVEEDIVFEIELTPNRSDATSHLGVARDLAAYLIVNEGYRGHVQKKDLSHFKKDMDGLAIPVVVEDTKACPRYSGVTISGVTVKDSPSWLQNRLRAIGLRPINNIVDITNYILHEYGQPLHAFDADRIPGAGIKVKKLPAGTAFKTLDEVERKLTEHDLMICGSNSEGLCIAGVFGGLTSGVTDETKNIFLESAHFDAKTVRKTSMHHILRTDAAMVFEKGSDPSVTVEAMKRAAVLIKEISGGQITSDIVDIYPIEIKPAVVDVKYLHIHRLIGLEIPVERLKRIFLALNFNILEERNDGALLQIPTDKADVTREADVIEEVLRIYGLNNVPLPEKVTISVSSNDRKENYRVRNQLSEYLTGQSFYEAMSLSLNSSKKYLDTGVCQQEELVYINNTSNVQLDILRPEMLFSAMENVAYNQNRQQKDLLMFEFGKAYKMVKGEVDEKEYLCVFGTGMSQPANWKVKNPVPVDDYLLKSHCINLMNRLNINSFSFVDKKDNRFEQARTIICGNLEIGMTGKVNNKLSAYFGVKQDMYFAQFDFDKLIGAASKQFVIKEISRFPGTTRDIALVLDKKIKYEELEKEAFLLMDKTLKAVDLFDVYENEVQFGKDKWSYALTFRFEDVNKTLKDEEIDTQINRFMDHLEQKFDLKVRK
jgi:phenylalanyl-tRNA synthetase beta chain